MYDEEICFWKVLDTISYGYYVVKGLSGGQVYDFRVTEENYFGIIMHSVKATCFTGYV